MYETNSVTRVDDHTVNIEMPADRPFRILQITDTHFGFGPFSRRQDAMAEEAVRAIVRRGMPDLIIFTGDMFFPVFNKAGTVNNGKQAKRFLEFADSLNVPYAMVFGNHDAEFLSMKRRRELSAIFETGKNSLFLTGPENITGYSNEMITLSYGGIPQQALLLIDSNMYGKAWILSGYDCIHSDQTEYFLSQLQELKWSNPKLTAMAFFHMPVPEYEEAYFLLKHGDPYVTYHFGSIQEKHDHFGVTRKDCAFFREIRKEGTVRALFCGHDHLNDISMTWKGIRMTYGMAIDYLAYPRRSRMLTRRGGTLITCRPGSALSESNMDIRQIPLGEPVPARLRPLPACVELPPAFSEQDRRKLWPSEN